MDFHDSTSGARRMYAVTAGLAAILLAGCGGGSSGAGGSGPQAEAINPQCAATVDADGVLVLPLVSTPQGDFRYTLVPAPTLEDPDQYIATLAGSDVSPTVCPAIAFSPATGVLVADAVPRMGQLVSVTLKLQPNTGGVAFDKVGAGVRGGWLDGYAGDDVPLAGGNVVVTDAAGAVLARGTTNAWGAMQVPITSLPDTFLVSVSGGTMSGRPFAGTLKAEVDDYATDDAQPSINVTPVTTLVAAYHQRFPGLSLVESMARVGAQLGMPDTLDLDPNHQGTMDYFDNAAFYAAADAAGGVDALVQAVIADWVANTPHDFAPAGGADRLDPPEIMKILLPGDIVPNYKTDTATCGGPCASPRRAPMREIATAATVIGTAYSLYAGNKTMQWQDNVIIALDRITRQLDQLQSSLTNVETKLGALSYKADRARLDKWEKKVPAAIRAMKWIATNPSPEGAACDAATPSQTCMQWADRVQIRRDLIRSLTNVANEELFDPMFDFRLALLGDKFDAGSGMLAEFRGIVLAKARATDPTDEKGRGFFSWEHSNLIWDHFRYWENLQAMTYFVFADYYTGLGEVGKDSFLEELEVKYNALVAEQKPGTKAVPSRVLPQYTYVDTRNTDWYGVNVGGPLMWWPSVLNTCLPLRYVPYDTANVQVQRAMRDYFTCMNSGSAAGKGFNDWKLPTVREWAAFTLTEGRPSRDVWAWLEKRGIKAGSNMNGQFVYATASDTCNPGPNLPADYCATHSYYFTPFYQSGPMGSGFSFSPFLKFNVDHTPGSFGASLGAVFPVRKVFPGEFY